MVSLFGLAVRQEHDAVPAFNVDDGDAHGAAALEDDAHVLGRGGSGPALRSGTPDDGPGERGLRALGGRTRVGARDR